MLEIKVVKWLKTGHNVEIQIDETGDNLKAKIISLGAAVDAVSQTIKLKAKLKIKLKHKKCKS